MVRILECFTFCVCCLLSSSWKIVQESSNQKIYLLSHGVAREIENKESLTAFGHGYGDRLLENITLEILAEFRLGQSLRLTPRENATPDEIMRVELQLIHALQENLLYDITTICTPCKNPSVIIWDDQALLCAEFYWKIDVLMFTWVNWTKSFVVRIPNHLGISSETYASIDSYDLPGNDCRMLNTQSGGVYIAYSTEKVSPTRVGLAELDAVNSTEGLMSAKYSHNYPVVLPDMETNKRQKNWAPFYFNNTLHFIQRINPMRVVEVFANPDEPQFLNSRTVSVTDYVASPWEYGELRGGTNALLIKADQGMYNQDFYLAFFHSLTVLQDAGRHTYFFGAYTFTATIPFRLLGLSPVPIIDDALYTGPWFKFHSLQVDYVVYPTSFFILDHEIHLCFGHNDVTGYMAKLNLRSLLDSLVPL